MISDQIKIEPPLKHYLSVDPLFLKFIAFEIMLSYLLLFEKISTL